jgi:hypothetical protein
MEKVIPFVSHKTENWSFGPHNRVSGDFFYSILKVLSGHPSSDYHIQAHSTCPMASSGYHIQPHSTCTMASLPGTLPYIYLDPSLRLLSLFDIYHIQVGEHFDCSSLFDH